MDIKTQALQLDQAIDEASDNIMAIFRQEGCGYNMYASPRLNKGINIEFLFRGETDYSLLVPWEYTQDDTKIRDYFKRFLAFTEPGDTISDVSRLADIFIENEFELLKGIK